jgi:hypothetical protein
MRDAERHPPEAAASEAVQIESPFAAKTGQNMSRLKHSVEVRIHARSHAAGPKDQLTQTFQSHTLRVGTFFLHETIHSSAGDESYGGRFCWSRDV